MSGTAPAGSSGSYGDIVLSVSNDKATVKLAVFTITVTAPVVAPPAPASTPAPVPTPTPTLPTNTAPTISGAPAPSVTAGQAYAFSPSAADSDGDLLRFGIANKPASATFDSVTGRRTGTPTAADAGSYGNIVVAVSDGKASATLPAFSVNVVAPVTGSAELRWTAPTQNEDGSLLSNLAGDRIRYGASPTSLTQTVVIATPGTSSVLIEGLTAGTWYFTVAS